MLGCEYFLRRRGFVAFNEIFMKRMKQWFAMMTLVTMAMQLAVMRMPAAMALSTGGVVINEISWAGSADGTSDEWIELYNTTNQSVDLSGWYIEDDGVSVYAITSGVVAAKGYFLIEDAEIATDVVADAIIPISLANAGDSLVLKDDSDVVIDTVNGSGGAWYAGNSMDKSTMERIDPGVVVDSTENWGDAVSGNGTVGRSGGAILGTPGSANSTYGGSGPEVSLNPMENIVNQGDTLTVSVVVNNMVDLYAYGIEVDYDSTILSFVSASEGSFLDADGSATAFNASLEGGNEGTIVVGNARLSNPPMGIDGSGVLFDLTFDVDPMAVGSGTVSFGGGSYLSDSIGDVPAQFNGVTVSVDDGVALTISNLTAEMGVDQYSLNLSWEGAGATSYIVQRQEVDGNFVQLAEVTNSNYIDSLNIVPNVTYNYQVIAINGGSWSAPVGVNAIDDRGLTGDNDRSGRVDGRDIEQLARAYGSGFGDEEYNPLVDTNYDGIIDGSDLIDIGVNFGMTY